MVVCFECGGDAVAAVRLEGVALDECGLCGALSGDDAAGTRVLLAREAREHGIDPGIYPLVVALNSIPELQVVMCDAGDPAGQTWPFVQFAPTSDMPWRGIENLVKSLALSARGEDVHWVIEVEYQSRLVLTLKPRFHRDVSAITSEDVEAAQSSLERVRVNLEAHMRLSWWRR